jgi:hypothetical protein
MIEATDQGLAMMEAHAMQHYGIGRMWIDGSEFCWSSKEQPMQQSV